MSWLFTSNTYDGRSLKLSITETVSPTTNSSILKWTLTSSGGNGTYYAVDTTTIRINGVTVYTKPYTAGSSHEFPAAAGSVSGTTTVVHNDDGTKTGVPVVFKTNVWYHGSGTIPDWGGSINLTAIPTYTLFVSSDAGSSASVTRTSSGYASTGTLSSGVRLYAGDTLKIVFSASDNYGIDTHTVNGETFTSGNTYTVSADTYVVVSSQVLASSVGATDASIGSVSAITVTKYNPNYYHSLHFTFGSLSGYIRSSGSISNTEIKYQQTSVAFTIPSTFYNELVSATSGTCTITCRTYRVISDTEVLGEPTTCQFEVYVPASQVAPIVTGSVIDTNPVTLALTDDNTVIVRYRSTARCTITATPRNSSIIVSRKINGHELGDNDQISFANTSATEFIFEATDSRGYTTSKVITPTVIPYLMPTCNPTLSRPSSTSTDMYLSATGNFYHGAFKSGGDNNSITISYRYREKGTSSYSSWSTLDVRVSLGTTTYSLSNTHIPGSYDHAKAYEFQVRVRDGVGGTTLGTIIANAFIQQGIPVFDWGENDFNVNGELRINNTNICDIFYPVGAIYLHSTNSLPPTISDIGTWVSIETGLSGIYGWKRSS